MTESDWNSGSDPQVMLDFLWSMHILSIRKLRLFFCARSRHIWDMLAPPDYQRAVEVAERLVYADVDDEGLRRVYHQARDIFWGRHPAAPGQGVSSELETMYFRLYVAVLAANPRLGSIRPFWHQVRMVRQRMPEEGEAECRLLRELFGPLPFRAISIDTGWLSWNGGIVRELAQVTYDERILPEGRLGQSRLAILADALEEAGCDNKEILVHCRQQNAAHVRGCWVLDLLLFTQGLNQRP